MTHSDTRTLIGHGRSVPPHPQTQKAKGSIDHNVGTVGDEANENT